MAKKDTKLEEVLLEPREYFESLKTKLSVSDFNDLKAQLDVVAGELLQAKEIGLDHVVHKLSFLYNVILKEQLLLTQGFDTFVYKDNVVEFIDKITPKNSVKIVELSRFPRLIPKGPAELIMKAKKLDVFDDLFVIYTDFTDEKVETPAEKEFVNKNRDPIVFGAFVNTQLAFKHERFYFIADWEDEFCDLTFSKMIEKMGELGMEDPTQHIGFDHAYVNSLANEVLVELKSKELQDRQGRGPFIEKEETNYVKTFIKWISKTFTPNNVN